MKHQTIAKLLLTAIVIASTPFNALLQPQTARATSVTPIYVSFVTHNEQPDSGRYPDFTASESDFWEQHDAVAAYADMLHSMGATYNWQSSWNFLLAATMYGESGDTATDGKNIVAYLQSLGFSVNVHGHASSYNYADDAYLIDQLGTAPSGVMGGFVATPASSNELEDFWQTQHGDVYSYSWTPTVLWGASGFGHAGDSDLEISGVWKPKDNEHFLTHSDSAPLPVIGPYTSDWDGLNELLADQAAGDLDPTVMHTATIMVDQDELLTQSERDAVQAKIAALQDDVDAGNIIWMSLEDVASTWETTYNSVPSIFQASTQAYAAVTTAQESTGTTTTTTDTASSSTDASGSLIKTACSAGYDANDPCTAVYYLTSDGLRHAFPNEKVYMTWYENFDDVATISASEMASHTLGKNVTYRPGTRMVKFITVNTVYAVSRGGELRPIASEDVAASLYGSDWNTQVDDISDAFYGSYTIGSTIDSEGDYNPSGAEAATTTIETNFNG